MKRFRCGLRRLWARLAAKLEDTHRRRTVMANAKANAAEMKAWADLSIETAADIWLPTDFDG